MILLVTGGAGFIGSAVIRHWIQQSDDVVINVDKLTYAANLAALGTAVESPRYLFEQVDICDAPRVARLFTKYRPDAVLHLAAESHVDRSIDSPAEFLRTNVQGTYTLLEAARDYWQRCCDSSPDAFCFHHVSTDEVYGSLGLEGRFSEASPYHPNSPYAASKAASDHLVRAWHHTYGLPTLVTQCSNNFGPGQHAEKLIPRMISCALAGQPLPVYGDGCQVRDWLYVEDHVRALRHVLLGGTIGETYTIGGSNERTNLEVVRLVCKLLDELCPQSPHRPHARLITSVADRPGHDRRYAVDAGKIRRQLGWQPQESFESGLRKTVAWYLTQHARQRELSVFRPGTECGNDGEPIQHRAA